MARTAWETPSRAYLREAPNDQDPANVDRIIRDVERVRELPPAPRVLEVGLGTGWLLSALVRRGWVGDGVELNPWFCEHARAELAAQGIEASVIEGSIESIDLAADAYDLVLAESVLEHVLDVHSALAAIYRTLKSGGVLHFNTTNKLALISGEYPEFPLYGWLPRRVRLRFRREATAMAPSGFDLNQFTYWGLRRRLAHVGFSEIYDRFDLLEPSDKSGLKRQLIAGYKRWPILKQPFLALDHGCAFCCVK
jgi:SAM-dependent methyltransferase